MRATPRDWAMLISLGMIWGAAFMATKTATEAFDPFTITAARLGLAAVAVGGAMVATGARLPGLASRQERLFWAAAAAVAVLSNAMPFTALAWGQRYIPSALAGVFMASVPLFVLPLGHLFVPGETMTGRKIVGFGLGFLGVLVLIGPSVVAELGGGPAIALLAQGACLLAATGYASGSIVAKRAPQFGLFAFGAAALMLAAAITVPLALIFEDPFDAVPGWPPVLAVIYLGLVPTALATVMLLAVIRSAGPGFLALVNYQVPVWAVIFGAVVLGETPSPRLGAALVLILAGLAVAQGRLGLRRGGHAQG